MDMVTAEATKTAESVQNVLEGREIGAFVGIAASSAGGAMAAQRIANRVLPSLGLSPDPQTLLEAAGSAGVKGGLAAAFGLGASKAGLSGFPLVAAAFMAVGALTSAGIDLIAMFLDIPDVQAMRHQTGGQSGASVSVSRRSSPSVNSTEISSSGGSNVNTRSLSRSASTDGGRNQKAVATSMGSL
jgi:hypothetical protein